MGATQTRFGWKVVAQLAGGAPTLKMTYFVERARWYPLYDLALNSDTGKVTVAFSGMVSQESGEDWSDAALTLSTAVPATATTLPRLLTWKIGEKERFIPTPTPVRESVRPPPGRRSSPSSDGCSGFLVFSRADLRGCLGRCWRRGARVGSPSSE